MANGIERSGTEDEVVVPTEVVTPRHDDRFTAGEGTELLGFDPAVKKRRRGRQDSR